MFYTYNDATRGNAAACMVISQMEMDVHFVNTFVTVDQNVMKIVS